MNGTAGTDFNKGAGKVQKKTMISNRNSTAQNGQFGAKKLRPCFRIESPISLRVSAEWLEALDKWREEQPVKPSRTAVIVTAVTQFIASQSPKPRNSEKK
jgi:hypothetical protein